MKKFNSSKEIKAFSLIEMSLVVVIIGLLIFGITKGGNLITSSRLNAAKLLTQRSVVPKIDGLVAWYETSLPTAFPKDEAIDGSQISTWYDNNPDSLEGSKNTLTRTASSSLLYEELGINNLPSLYFVSTANLVLSDFYQGSDVKNTIFLVIQPSSISSSDEIIVDSASGSQTYVSITNSDINIYIGSYKSYSTTIASGENYIIASYLSPRVCKTYVNDPDTMVDNTTRFCGTNQRTGLTVGTDMNGSNPYTGFISEVIIYNRGLKDQERTDVMKYLSRKYNINI